jgi:hypothetical protein
MAKMTKEVMEVFNHERAAKALATADKEGKVNVVPIFSLAALDEETLAFADLTIKKTKANLNATKKATALALVVPEGGTPKGYQAKGTFVGFQTSGPVYDVFQDKVRKAMKRGVKGVGFIKVEEVYEVTPGSGGAKVV